MPPILRNPRLNQLPVFFAPFTVASFASTALSAASSPAFFAPFLVALAAFFAPDFVLSPTSSALSPTSCPTFFVVSTVLSTAFSASCFTPLSCRATACVLIPATNANANSTDKKNFDITPALPSCNEIKHFPLCPTESATPVPYQRPFHHSSTPT